MIAVCCVLSACERSVLRAARACCVVGGVHVCEYVVYILCCVCGGNIIIY